MIDLSDPMFRPFRPARRGERFRFQNAGWRVVWIASLCAGFWPLLPLDAQPPRPRPSRALPDLPAGQPPIDYFGTESQDRVARLQAALSAGRVKLVPDAQRGWLPALLKELEVPVASQVLLPSTGSPHRFEITPQRPRALYANDDVSIAWYPGTQVIEFAAQDPRKGTLFYQAVAEGEGLRFSRPNVCLACHSGTQTGLEVIGHNLNTGLALNPQGPTGFVWRTHRLPFDRRWERHYVSGTLPAGFSGEPWPLRDDAEPGRYPVDACDPVALLIRDHWNYGLNLLNRWSYEHQLGVPSVEDRILPRYLLIPDEPSWPGPLPRDTAYVRWFEQQGPRTADGRSLRQLNLQSRTFAWQMSPLLLTRMVQEQPAPIRRALYARLDAYLAGTESFPNVELDRERCAATRSLLRELLPEWPAP